MLSTAPEPGSEKRKTTMKLRVGLFPGAPPHQTEDLNTGNKKGEKQTEQTGSSIKPFRN